MHLPLHVSLPRSSSARVVRRAAAALLAAAVLALTSCGQSSGASGAAGTSGASGAPRVKRVVTTFTILQDMAQNVAGDKLLVESITKPGAEIHEYEPTPLDIVKAQQADLVLRNGLGLERWFERFMDKVRDVPSVDLSSGVQPMSIGEGPYNGKPNPHAWMSPANAVTYVENIRDAFIKLDPANEPSFRASADSYIKQIRSIDAGLKATLDKVPAEQRWLVSSEGAFSYLARDCGMKELFLWPVNADQEGTPQQVQKVVDTVRKHRIPVCFSESTISDKPMRQVCTETGARYGGVLYVDSLTDEGGEAPTYVKLLQFNANALSKGLLPQ